MPPPSPPPGERRRDNALRALYLRVDTLEKLSADQATLIAVLEERAVTKNWLMGGFLSVALAVFAGAWVFKGGLEESAAKPLRAQAEAIAKQGERLDKFIDTQTPINVRTEAMYLLTVERRPRDEVRETVQRSTPGD